MIAYSTNIYIIYKVCTLYWVLCLFSPVTTYIANSLPTDRSVVRLALKNAVCA
jgi:hypothetical protein